MLRTVPCPGPPVLPSCGWGWNRIMVSFRRHFIPNPVAIDSTAFQANRRARFLLPIHTRYDKLNRPVCVLDAAGVEPVDWETLPSDPTHSSFTRYDSLGHALSQADPLGRTTNYQ
jgi:hypothetical protein